MFEKIDNSFDYKHISMFSFNRDSIYRLFEFDDCIILFGIASKFKVLFPPRINVLLQKFVFAQHEATVVRRPCELAKSVKQKALSRAFFIDNEHESARGLFAEWSWRVSRDPLADITSVSICLSTGL